MMAVSYLLTSYNKAAHLPSVLESIAREQARTGGEIIIVDDGSIDGSVDICAKFAATHPSVIFVHQENRGIYAALNRAIPLAKGRWLRLCDGDDPLIVRSTEYLIEMAAMENADVVYGQALPYGPAPLSLHELDAVRPVSYASVVHPDALLHLIQSMDFSTSRSIYRTYKVKQAMPLPENLISCPDFALAVRVAAKGRVVKLREPVCYCLTTPTRQPGVTLALTHHQAIRILQSSRRLLRRRHRNAALAEFVKWSSGRLRSDVHGWQLRARRMKLRLLCLAAKLGLYDWHAALDEFAAMYEPELAPIFRRRVKQY